MKYLSIDIETTGLDPEKHDIIEFAAVLEDTNKQIEISKLPYFYAFISRYEDRLWNMDTFKFHWDNGNIGYWMSDAPYEKELDHGTIYGGGQLPLITAFTKWLNENIPMFDDRTLSKINLAGKNIQFDLSFLEQLKDWDKIKFHRRHLDPAILYWQNDDECLPSLDECRERAGLEGSVTHRALDDARLVIKLIRKYWKSWIK